MRRVSSLGAMLVGALALGRGVPGCGASSFVCEGDESCAGLADGQCEADGRCSVPDADCSSGRRYAAHSGDVSGHCVGEAATGTGTGTSATQASETNRPSTSADEGSTSSPPATTGSSTTGGPVSKACGSATVVDEPFDAPPIDAARWDLDLEPNAALDVIDGELHVTVFDALDAYGDLESAFGLPATGRAGVELGVVPTADLPAEIYFVLTDSDIAYGFEVDVGQLDMIYDDGFDEITLQSLPYDPMAHRWLRLVFDSDTEQLAWEVAPSLGDWQELELAELELGFDPSEASIIFGAGVYEGPIDLAPVATFGHAFVCEGLMP